MEEETAKWPECYYNTEKPEERRSMLEQRLAQEETEDDLFRYRLFDLRYEYRKKENMYADLFIRTWLDLMLEGKSLRSSLFAKRRARVVEQAVCSLGMELPKQCGENAGKILSMEYDHLANLMIALDLRDKNYGNLILGIGKRTEEQLVKKIGKEFGNICIRLPKATGKTEEFQLFAKIVLGAYENKFPGKENYLDQAK